jgi:hypothetical protein
MVYDSDSKWWTLSQALERVMVATGETEDQVKADICRAILDGAIEVQGKLKESVTTPRTSDGVVQGKELRPWHDLKPENLDWKNSRPLKAWDITANRLRIYKLWYLEWIKLSVADVKQHLCRPGKQEAAQRTDAGAASRSRPASQSSGSVGSDTRSIARSGPAGPARRRGRRPEKFEQTVHAIRTDIQQRRRSVAELANMREKELEAAYGVSRDTARRARDVVLPEFDEN